MLKCVINDFCDNHITDKGVMICATIESILKKQDVGFYLKKWKLKYNNLYFGQALNNYLETKKPIETSGINGPIRTIPYIFTSNDLNKIIDLALKNANTTHIGEDIEKGTKALITSLFMVKNNEQKHDIYKEISKIYDLDNIEKKLFKLINETPICQNIIPQAIIVFLKAKTYNDCVTMSMKFKGNFKSVLLIAGTLFNLSSQKIDTDLLRNFYMYCSEDVFDLVQKYDIKYY